MSYRSGFLIPVLAAALASQVAGQGPEPSKLRLKAREFFYLGGPDANAEKGAQKAAPKAASKTAAKTSAKGKAAPSPDPAAGQGKGSVSAGAKSPDGTPVILAAAGPPLGLKYTIVKRDGGQAIEVPDDTVFHTGDRIQLKIETNGPGYLYIVSQGPGGAWKAMFPAPEIGGGNNHVDANRPVTLPAQDYGMTFVQPAGTEKVTIVLSRQPVPDFEELIYSLQDRAQPVARPAAPAEKEQSRPLVADASIGDPTVARLRTLYSRDLIIEKVTPETPGERKETAAYVVNPSGAADSRLVADLRLVHQ